MISKKKGKSAKLQTLPETDKAPPTKQEILDSITEGIHLAKLHQQGKIKLKTAQQLLDEL